MGGRRVSRRTAVATVGLVLLGLASVAAPAPAAAQAPDEAPLLDAAAFGEAAIDALGDQLATAAERSRLTVEALTDLLASDANAGVDPDGHAYFVDPAPADPGEATAVTAAPFPLADTFRLHSRPGAQRTIFLDFDGGVISGTQWNDADGVSSTADQPGFTTDADESTFTAAERTAIQSAYQRVAEDFAPFEVDVTTEDPGVAALDRSSAADTRYGTRVFISSSTPLSDAVCESSCGGVAYIGVFDLAGSSGRYQPALVFPHLLGDDAKNIAEAASHEAGHTLGLAHDGVTGGPGYYEGHDPWAPIMGVGYSQPVSQWSQGEYSRADNDEDDLAVMVAHGLPYRADDHGDTRPGATALAAGATATGVISTRADLDLFATTCGGVLGATVDPAPTGPDLDVRLRILSSTGTALATAAPTTTRVGRDQADGLGATASAAVDGAAAYLEVSGVGQGTATSGYSDYGSLGAYTLRTTCTRNAVSVADASVVEGASFSRSVAVTVSLASPAASRTTVHLATVAGGTATVGADYTAEATTVTFSAGQQTKTVVVKVKGDRLDEGDETIAVALDSPSANVDVLDGSATITIVDDDRTPRVAIADAAVLEGNKAGLASTTKLVFTVQLDSPAVVASSVQASTIDGTAVAPGDYTALDSTVVKIAAGATSATVTVVLRRDLLVEGDETFTVVLHDPIGVLITGATATGTILDDPGG